VWSFAHIPLGLSDRNTTNPPNFPTVFHEPIRLKTRFSTNRSNHQPDFSFSNPTIGFKHLIQPILLHTFHASFATWPITAKYAIKRLGFRSVFGFWTYCVDPSLPLFWQQPEFCNNAALVRCAQDLQRQGIQSQCSDKRSRRPYSKADDADALIDGKLYSRGFDRTGMSTEKSVLCAALQNLKHLNQGWGTCGPREHLIWPATEFSLPKLEYNIASKRSSVIGRYLGSKSREVTRPHS